MTLQKKVIGLTGRMVENRLWEKEPKKKMGRKTVWLSDEIQTPWVWEEVLLWEVSSQDLLLVRG